MSNITLSVDDEIIKKVRKIAIDRNTTLTEMVRKILILTAESDRTDRERAVRKLRKSFAELSRVMGQRVWTRDELHER